MTNALPVIRQALHAGLEGLEWTVNAYTLTFAVLLLARESHSGAGRLGGRRIVAIGVALQAIGIGWLAAEIAATIPYADLIPPFLIAGTGLGFFFAPTRHYPAHPQIRSRAA